jgi:hypothetical protein
MSAPAMKPAAFPERKISPFGGCYRTDREASASSSITALESELVDSPALSSVAQAIPAASTSSRQF